MGFSNKSTASKCDAIHTVDGKSMQTKLIGSINVVHHNKRGMEVQSFMCQEVTRTPYGRFSLFSLSKIVNELWTLHGDENALVLRRGKN